MNYDQMIQGFLFSCSNIFSFSSLILTLDLIPMSFLCLVHKMGHCTHDTCAASSIYDAHIISTIISRIIPVTRQHCHTDRRCHLIPPDRILIELSLKGIQCRNKVRRGIVLYAAAVVAVGIRRID